MALDSSRADGSALGRASASDFSSDDVSPPGSALAFDSSRAEGSALGSASSRGLLVVVCQAHEDILHRAAGLLEVIWRVQGNHFAAIQNRQPIAQSVGFI